MPRLRIRRGGLAAVLVFGLLGAGACEKANSGNGSASDLALLPADSELVLSIDAAQLRRSAIWNELIKPAIDKAVGDDAEFNQFKAACGVDPITAVTHGTLGVNGLGDTADKFVAVVHGVPKSKLTSSCFETIKALAEKHGGSVAKDGDVYLWKDEVGDISGFMFVGDDTLLLTDGKSLATKDAILKVAKGHRGVAASATFTRLFEHVNAHQTMWMVLTTTPPALADALAPIGAKPTAFWGSINITDGISAEGGARFASANAAKAVADKLDQIPQLGMVKMFVDKLAITADGADVKGSVLVSKAKIDAVKQAHIFPGLQ